MTAHARSSNVSLYPYTLQNNIVYPTPIGQSRATTLLAWKQARPSICCICNEHRSLLNNPLLVCATLTCDVVVHQFCYEAELCCTSNSSSSWYCQRCLSGIDRVTCLVCPSNQGAFYPVGDIPGGWIHTVCALAIPNVIIQRTAQHQCQVFVTRIALDYWQSCTICDDVIDATEGVCIPCAVEHCTHRCHITCGYLASDTTIPTSKWSIYCPDHGQSKGIKHDTWRNWSCQYGQSIDTWELHDYRTLVNSWKMNVSWQVEQFTLLHNERVHQSDLLNARRLMARTLSQLWYIIRPFWSVTNQSKTAIIPTAQERDHVKYLQKILERQLDLLAPQKSISMPVANKCSPIIVNDDQSSSSTSTTSSLTRHTHEDHVEDHVEEDSNMISHTSLDSHHSAETSTTIKTNNQMLDSHNDHESNSNMNESESFTLSDPIDDESTPRHHLKRSPSPSTLSTDQPLQQQQQQQRRHRRRRIPHTPKYHFTPRSNKPLLCTTCQLDNKPDSLSSTDTTTSSLRKSTRHHVVPRHIATTNTTDKVTWGAICTQCHRVLF
ncbi:hypothetical protein BDF22DRAFT_444059 [Syncephalis plumigaleata]|nr:hypothetical protein BDF22DRAFT_444059 [Syncephalis plumigaleata]